MRIIRGLQNLRADDANVVATLGNFDGVHCGHQALLKQLGEFDPALRRCVVLFEPQPLEFLRPDIAPVRLQPLAEKLRYLQALGLEQALVLPFDEGLSTMPARVFAEKVLIQGLGVRALVIGDDWRFGYQRQGDFKLLQQLSNEHGFALEKLKTVTLHGERVSSTRVRQALSQGDVAVAGDCLGRPFSIRGRVIHGQKLGRELGAPTANVAMRTHSALRYGVYCVRLEGQPAVCNLGVRPTVEGSQGEHLEVHLLHGTHQLYDQVVRVEFEKFIRPEKTFSSLDELKRAIAGDVQVAHQHFQSESQ